MKNPHLAKTLLLMFLTTPLLSSCVSLESISMTSIPEQRDRKVSAESSRFIIFFMNFDNDYVDRVNIDLKNQCPQGKVTGILTRDENTNYFLGFFMKRTIKATGYCVR